MRTGTVLIVGAGIAAVACCGGVAWLGSTAYRAYSNVQKDGIPVAKEFITKAGQRWNVDDVKPLLSDAFLRNTSRADSEATMAAIEKTLGPLKSVGEFTVDGYRDITNNGVRTLTVGFKAPATFAKGDGTVNVNLVSESGHWKVLSFRVNSPLLDDWKRPGDGEAKKSS